MSEHTKGKKWKVILAIDSDEYAYIASGSTYIAQNIRKEHANRIVHCVNNFDTIEQQRDDLRDACKAAMRIKTLWLPQKPIENADEGKALQIMHDMFEQALAGVKK